MTSGDLFLYTCHFDRIKAIHDILTVPKKYRTTNNVYYVNLFYHFVLSFFTPAVHRRNG